MLILLHSLPPWARELLVKFATAAFVILPFVFFVAVFSMWLERKVAGRIQSRPAPIRTGGFHGWAETLADGIKLLTKENLVPAGADSFLFRLAPYLAFIPALTAFLFLPWSRDLSEFTKTINAGVFFLLAVLGTEVLGVIVAGWVSNNNGSLFAVMRAACQRVSYEIPLGLSIITAVMVAGSLNLYTISREQSAGFHHWLLFHDPFNMLAFLLYSIAALASCRRVPFDLPGSELVSGCHTEYSGLQVGFFFFAEYVAIFAVAGIQVSLWLGAWYDPFGIVAALESISHNGVGNISNWSVAVIANALGASIFIIKAFLLIYVQLWLRWTLPRLRIDHVLYFCIKVLLPVGCSNLLAAAAYLWLVEPLTAFQSIVQVLLAVLGVALAGAVAALVLYAHRTRDPSTFKILFARIGLIPDSPGA